MFLQSPTKALVPGKGPKDAKTVVVGEFTDAWDYRNNKPFSGPAGQVLEQCLHAAELIRGEIYLTNVIKYVTNPHSLKEYYIPAEGNKRGKFTPAGYEQIELLKEELNEVNPNVIVTAGPAALTAVTGLSAGHKLRGYVVASRGLAREYKVIPTVSPAATVHKNYIDRQLLLNDLRKVKLESTFPEIVRPERQLVYSYQTVEEALEWLSYYAQQTIVCWDIEVLNYETSCISFSSEPDVACVIPIAGRWTEDEEVLIWLGIQEVLGNPKSVKVGQNLIFDIQFLLARNGIEVKGPIHDTMIGHSVMLPELPKGLGFLGSLYCGSQEYWKDLVSFDNIKEES